MDEPAAPPAAVAEADDGEDFNAKVKAWEEQRERELHHESAHELHRVLAHAHHDQHRGEHQKSEQVPPDWSFHARRHSAPVSNTEHWAGMLNLLPPFDRFPHDHDIGTRENGEHRR